MRFLCLHGMGTNNQVFEMQTAALRHELGEQHTFEFVEGSVECDAAPGIKALFPDCDEYFAYYTPDSPMSVQNALDELAAYVEAEGPYDGVMGFSQGATLAAMLLVRQTQLDPLATKPVFACAVFLCGGLPFDPAALEARGELRFVQNEGDSSSASSSSKMTPAATTMTTATVHEPITVPTANILGSADPLLEYSRELSLLCSSKLRTVFDHGGGHDIPRSPRSITADMADAVRKAIDRATFLQ